MGATMNMTSSVLVSGPKAVKAARPARVPALICRAQASSVDRRAVLGLIAASVSLLAGPSPSLAAYGDSANVFGRVTNPKGFVPYAGESFSLLLPSKWNPSKERDFPGVVLRYEDNGAAANNLIVIIEKSDKDSIEAYGSPEKFLEQYSYLLGKQAFSGETISEGGFSPNRVSAASLLEAKTEQDSKGKTYYLVSTLVRTADGDEGGKHQVIKATVSGGNLYLLKIQAGDKRWFKGAEKTVMGIQSSFTVA